MISMTDFKQIIILRNEGKSQEDIAVLLGISRRSVIRYLKSGKIPVYKRDVGATRIDPMANFLDLAKNCLETIPDISLNELFEHLKKNGYKGSLRSMRRKTSDIRKKLKNKEVFFQRIAKAGEVMEGDFTELQITIGGIVKKVYLWITSLPYSNSFFATPYFNCTFECFAEGSVHAFNEFGGIAKKYRLDNLSPVVTKILSGKERLVTQRFSQFQNYYGFSQDFCNPARGNEKGNIEANNKHFKIKLKSKIALEKLTFINLESFRKYVWSLCREHNQSDEIKNKFNEENLLMLPEHPFKSFRTEIVKINKYSLFSLGTSGHMYSVPSKYIGLSLEARIYPDYLEIIELDKTVCIHKRLLGVKGLVSINIEHVIEGLLRKPAAFRDWKYREIIFERPSWKMFYSKLIEAGKDEKEFLRCIGLLKEFDRENITLAMELAMEGQMELTSNTLKNLINNEFKNVLAIPELPVNLDQYDFLIKGDQNYEHRTTDVSWP
jgi:transposase